MNAWYTLAGSRHKYPDPDVVDQSNLQQSMVRSNQAAEALVELVMEKYEPRSPQSSNESQDC